MKASFYCDACQLGFTIYWIDGLENHDVDSDCEEHYPEHCPFCSAVAEEEM